VEENRYFLADLDSDHYLSLRLAHFVAFQEVIQEVFLMNADSAWMNSVLAWAVVWNPVEVQLEPAVFLVRA